MAHDLRGVKLRAEQDFPQERLDLVLLVLQALRQPGLKVGAGFRSGQIHPNLVRNKGGALALLTDNVDHIVTVPVAGLTQEGFLREISGLWLIAESAGGRSHPIASQGPGCFTDIDLRVPHPLAQRKKLHQLAREILIGPLGLATVEIQIPHHRGVAGDILGQRVEIPQRVRTQRLILLIHQVGAVNLIKTRGKVPMPEKRHLFAQGIAGVAHPLEPPGPHGPELFILGLA